MEAAQLPSSVQQRTAAWPVTSSVHSMSGGSLVGHASTVSANGCSGYTGGGGEGGGDGGGDGGGEGGGGEGGGGEGGGGEGGGGEGAGGGGEGSGGEGSLSCHCTMPAST